MSQDDVHMGPAPARCWCPGWTKTGPLANMKYAGRSNDSPDPGLVANDGW